MKCRRALLASAVLLAGASCARMASPDGGPPDETPPAILSVSPEPGAGLPGLDEISIIWDERLEEASVEVSLYPPMGSRLAIEGRKITVKLDQPIGGACLVLHLPGTLSDLRGNETGAPVDLAWAGGDSFPESAVTMTFQRQGGGVPGSRIIADILGPGGLLERRTSADTSFAAVAGWLEPGEYRLVCYEDPDFSFSWEPSVEAGLDTLVSLRSRDTLELALTLSVIDTIGPLLSSADRLGPHLARLSFNEQIELPEQSSTAFSLEDSTGAAVPVLGTWMALTREQRSVELAFAGDPAPPLSVRVESVRDMVGNRSAGDSLEVEEPDSLRSDSLAIRSFFPAPGAEGVSPSGPYSIGFSGYVDPDSLSSRLSVVRISDGSTTPGFIEREDGRTFLFTPEHELMGEEQYRIQLDSGLVSLDGDSLGSFAWTFVPAWGAEPGSISGFARGASAMTLEIAPAGSSGTPIMFGVSGGRYEVGPIPAGRYTVVAYCDSNGNGVWDGFGEPYGAAPGVIQVRPGVVTEGVDIEILP